MRWRRFLNIRLRALHNWIKAEAVSKLNDAGVKVSPEQMGIAWLRADLTRVKIERDILEKATAYFAKVSV